jgi:agmatine deiminase
MKKILITVTFLVIIFGIYSQNILQNHEANYNEYLEDSLAFQSKHRVLSFQEFLNLQEVQDFKGGLQETPPPSSPIRAIAEWEPNQGVIIRGHTSGGQGRFHIPFSVIADMSQHVIIYVTCTNAQQSQINTTLSNNGVNMTNVEYINVTTDSQWTRDYTPHFVEYGEDNEIGIMNFEYDRPRPNDNNFYSALGPHLGKTIFSMPMRHTGGNYMVDGFTSAVSTDHIYDDNWDELGLSPQEVDDMFEEYLGVSNYYLVYDALDLYIKHIDCWAKLLAPDKILILDVPESDSRHADFDAAANFWANETSPYGTNYQVFRVFTQPGTDEAYVNSLIMNDRVYVPIKGGASAARDAAAIAVYEAAMPGYNIVGVINDTGSTGWYDTDALHCRTYQVPDMNTVRITHFPYLEDVEIQENFNFTADIVSLGGGAITSAILNYRINNGTWQTENMNHVGNNIYEVDIDVFQLNDEIDYYIEASNSLGKTEFHPLIGEPDPHKFNIICPIISLGEDIEQCGGVVILDAGEGFSTYQWNGNPGNQTFTVSETGTYTVEVTDAFGCTINDEINVSLIPGSPIVTDESSCGSDNMTLTATGNGELYWYEEEVGGTQMHSGTEYTAFFDLTTSFYIEAVMDHAMSYYCGNTNSTTNGGNHTNNDFYLEFTAYDDFNLASIEVNANGAGNRIIELRDSDDNILEQVTRNIPNGESRVDVGFDITPGNYQLRCGTDAPNLFRSNTGVSFPYTVSDVVSITGSNAGQDFYYYFYDWEVQILEECVSERVQINAFVYPELEISMEAAPESSEGALDGTATVNIINGTPGYTFSWSNGGDTQTITNLAGGIYTVTVSDANNCEVIDNIEVITFDDGSPFVIFEADVTTGCESLTVQFTDLSLNDPTSWDWNFGDGNGSILQNPVHTYSSPGTYTVSLTATNTEGDGFDEIIDYIVVGENPTIIASNDGPFCEGQNILLNSTGSSGGDQYNWEGPEGFNSSDANPIRNNAIMDYAGVYSVTLTDSGTGCFASETTTVVINESPQLNADYDGPYCEGESINLSATGIGGNSYLWTGPNDFESTDQNPVINNASAGNSGQYIVTYTNTSTNCYATEILDVLVSPETFGGNVTGGSTINFGETSETLTLTDNIGGPIMWQYSINLVDWTDITHTELNYISDPLYSTTHFRAVVQSGTCDMDYSEHTTVIVDLSSIVLIDTLDVDGLDYVFFQFIADEFEFNPTPGITEMDVLIVAGGGGGAGSTGNAGRGGGGAGGLVFLESFSVTEPSYNITVGQGGQGGASEGANGSSGENTVFHTYVALGGGFGGNLSNNGGNGGSGGGTGVNNDGFTGGAAQQPGSPSEGFGNNGGASGPWAVGAGAGGGGGAGTAGNTGTDANGGAGGQGLEFTHFATIGGYPAGWFAGGGGGSAGTTGGEGGNGGGGDGSNNDNTAGDGIENTGGGGGGSQNGPGGNGGAGTVIISYLLKPTPEFVASQTEICEGETINFTDLTENAPETWSWTFEGGIPATSNEQNPSVTYNSAGVFAVQLNVTNTGGNASEIKTFYISVNENPMLDNPNDITACDSYTLPALTIGEYFANSGGVNPIAIGTEIVTTQTIYVYAETGTTPNCYAENNFTVTIIDSPSIDLGEDIEQCGGAATLEAGAGFEYYEWNGNEGGQTFVVNESGTYNLVVEDANGCSATDQITVTIHPELNITTESTSESAPDANDGTATVIISGGTPEFGIEWSNGGDTPTITDLSGNTYFVTVTDANFCSDESSVIVNTNDAPPVANFTADVTQGCDEMIVQFTDLSSNNPTSWSWDFGDGNDSNEQNPQHTYTSHGIYTVSLSVSNDDGGSDIEFNEYILVGETPQLALSMTEESEPGALDGTATVTVTSSYPYTVAWDTGADTETITNLVGGIYCVTVINTEFSCPAENCIEVTTGDAPPIANFEADITEGCDMLTVQFTNLSTNGPSSWLWDFGDGNSSNEQNPVHTYTFHGLYTVSLTVTNDGGSDDISFTDYILVGETPQLTLSMTEESEPGAEDGTATLAVTSAYPYTVAWDTGADTETITNLVGGIYCVTVINTELSCPADDCIEVTTADEELYPPISDFEADVTNGCDMLTVQFTDLSENNPTSWLWEFGDGVGSVLQNPQYTYYSPGEYTVSLTVTNSDGSDNVTFTDYITIGETPEFDLFTLSASGPETADGEAWIDITAGIPPHTVLWSTGETETSVTGLIPGTYSVMVRDAYNCIKTEPFTIDWTTSILQNETIILDVYPNPANYSVFVKTHNIPDLIEFTDIIGKVIYSVNPTNTVNEIDVSSVKTGVYFLKIYIGEESAVAKIVVQ